MGGMLGPNRPMSFSVCLDSWCALASSGGVQGVRLAGSMCRPGQQGVYRDPGFQCRVASARGVRFRSAGSIPFWSIATSKGSQEALSLVVSFFNLVRLLVCRARGYPSSGLRQYLVFKFGTGLPVGLASCVEVM